MQKSKLESLIKQEERTYSAYIKDVETGRSKKYSAIESVHDALVKEKIFTKKGNIRKNISASKEEKISAILSANLINENSLYNKVNTRKKREERQIVSLENLMQEWDMGEAQAKRYVRNVTKLQNEYLLDKLFISSDDVRRITTTTDNLSGVEFYEVAKFIADDFEKNNGVLSKYRDGTDTASIMEAFISQLDEQRDDLKTMSLRSAIKKVAKELNINTEELQRTSSQWQNNR